MTALKDASQKFMLCAAETSGDALGADLMRALRESDPSIGFSGCGGDQMAAQGLDSLFDIEPLSVMGLVDALKALPAARHRANLLAHHAMLTSPSAAVFIDSWAFSAMAAKTMRQMSPKTRLIKYVAPQVWASRPQRAKTAARLFDGVMTLFDFEVAWFEREGLQAKAVGHPGFQRRLNEKHDGDAFRARHGLGASPLLIVAPGSRRSEIAQLGPVFREALDRLSEHAPPINIAVSLAPGREREVRAVFSGWPSKPAFIPAEERFEAFAAADAGLAASGTVSTELSISATPMAIAYRFDWLSALWVRSVATTKYASLVNIAMDEEIIPEFIQDACEPGAIADALLKILTNPQTASRQLNAFPAALQKLGAAGPPASEKAAQTLLAWVQG
ncbi:MAG: lipid-A-disaccharide synthase [Pseudomonadota bacterium]